MLVADGEVTGVLDFEFSGAGYRAMEVAIGLASFSTRDWEIGPDWRTLEAFAAGYLARSLLTNDELGATPTLWVMTEATSFIHFLERMHQRVTTRDEIETRAHRFPALHRWTMDHQDQLVNALHRLARRE